MITKFINTIKKFNMINHGDKIIIGLSGGPDSVTLLHLLYTIKDEYDLELFGVHINHNLRGEESDQDELFVKSLCKNLNIPIFIEQGDIEALSREKKISLEVAGREFRYQTFKKYYDLIKANKIAIAHNLNDNAETILMRIIRGSGLEGLSGIKPVRGEIIRPLIDIARQEIEAYCQKNNLNPRIDSSNLENIYTRNKIRLELIPYIKKEFNNNIENTLVKMAKHINNDNAFISQYTNKIYKNVIIEKTEEYISLNLDKINKQSNLIIPRLLRIAINELNCSLVDIEAQNIEDAVNFIYNAKTGSILDLPKGLKLNKSYNTLIISKGEIDNNSNKFDYKLNIPGTLFVSQIGKIVECQILNNINDIIENKDVQCFDLDKINGELHVRTRQNGDRIVPRGLGGTKKLKDYFIDNKIPRNERDVIPLLTLDNQILWIIGYRLSDKYTIDANTKRILEVSIKEPQML